VHDLVLNKIDNLEYFEKNDENRARPSMVHQSTLSFFENGETAFSCQMERKIAVIR